MAPRATSSWPATRWAACRCSPLASRTPPHPRACGRSGLHRHESGRPDPRQRGPEATFGGCSSSASAPPSSAPSATDPSWWLRLRRDRPGRRGLRSSSRTPSPRRCPAVVRLHGRHALSTPPDVISGFLSSLTASTSGRRSPTSPRPVILVFNGHQDILTPPEHSELIVEGIPGAEHIVVNDAGHVIMLEHPDLLSAYLARASGAGHAGTGGGDRGALQPRVRRIVTDVAKGRRQRRIEREADRLVRAERARCPGKAAPGAGCCAGPGERSSGT